MSLLLALIASSAAGDDGDAYPYPEGVPYNVSFALDIPTPPSGEGQTTHPGVVDMGPEGWNGYRFWMVHTPYPNQTLAEENPCVACSHDGIVWVEPAGISNPISPWQGGTTWNSDGDIEYDPDTGRMWVIWRESPDNGLLTAVWGMWSTNGYQWSARQALVTPDDVAPGDIVVSPAIVRRGAGDWWMFSAGGGGVRAMRATAPEGPWTPYGFGSVANVGSLWHLDVTYDDGGFRLLANDRNPWVLRGSSSADGLTWTAATEPLITPTPGQPRWDNNHVHRGSMTREGDNYLVWYGGVSVDNHWRVGHTRIPVSHWGL